MHQHKSSGYRHQSPSYGGQKPKAKGWRHWKRWLVASMITIALVLLWQWPFSVMSSYIGLNGSRVARFSIASTGLPQTDSVQFILIDKDGNQTDTINCYVTPGEKLTLEGDVLSFAPWLNIFGLHSGYKPTALKGCALDPKH